MMDKNYYICSDSREELDRLNEAVSIDARNQPMVSQVNYFTEFLNGVKADVVLVLDDGSLVVRDCDIEDGHCRN